MGLEPPSARPALRKPERIKGAKAKIKACPNPQQQGRLCFSRSDHPASLVLGKERTEAAHSEAQRAQGGAWCARPGVSMLRGTMAEVTIPGVALPGATNPGVAVPRAPSSRLSAALPSLTARPSGSCRR